MLLTRAQVNSLWDAVTNDPDIAEVELSTGPSGRLRVQASVRTVVKRPLRLTKPSAKAALKDAEQALRATVT